MQLKWSSKRRVAFAVDIYEDEVATDTWKTLCAASEKGKRNLDDQIKKVANKAGIKALECWTMKEPWKDAEDGYVLQAIGKVMESDLDRAMSVSGGLHGGMVGLYSRTDAKGGEVRDPKHIYTMIWPDDKLGAPEAIAMARKAGILAKGLYRNSRGRGIRCVKDKDGRIEAEVREKIGISAKNTVEIRSEWLVEGLPAGMSEEDVQETLNDWGWETRVLKLIYDKNDWEKVVARVGAKDPSRLETTTLKDGDKECRVTFYPAKGKGKGRGKSKGRGGGEGKSKGKGYSWPPPAPLAAQLDQLEKNEGEMEEEKEEEKEAEQKEEEEEEDGDVGMGVAAVKPPPAAMPAAITRRGMEQALQAEREQADARTNSMLQGLIQKQTEALQGQMAEQMRKMHEAMQQQVQTQIAQVQQQVQEAMQQQEQKVKTFVGQQNLKRGPGGTPPRGKGASPKSHYPPPAGGGKEGGPAAPPFGGGGGGWTGSGPA